MLQQESERSRLAQIQYVDPSFTEGNAIFESLNGFILIINENSEVFYASRTVEQFIGFHQVKTTNQQLLNKKRQLLIKILIHSV